MDIFEKAFARFWPINSQKKKGRKGKGNSSAVYLDIIQKSLESFAGAVMSDGLPSIQGSPCLQTLGNSFVGMKNGFLYLPDEVNYFEDPEINRKVYLNIILQIAEAHQLGFKDSRGKLTPWESRLAFLEKIPRINQQIDSDFAGYRDFQRGLFDKLMSQIDPRKTTATLLDFWLETILSRSADAQTHTVQTHTDQRPPPELNQRKWTKEFAFLWLTVPCLEIQSVAFPDQSLTAGLGKSTPKETPQTELAKPKTGAVEVVDLEKESGNPVTHSFEKTETADEYQGGYKLDSGDDELQKHSQALDELDLSKITRGGEAALSIYRGEALELFGSQEQNPLVTASKAFLYPEWNYKKNSYRGKHCQLFENPLSFNSNLTQTWDSTLKLTLDPESNPARQFRRKLEAQHSSQIGSWQRKIQGLLNEPLWCGRLKEGDEIDWDSYVREFPAILQRRDLEGRWYSRKLKRVQEISVLILFDQSLSTDSWVKNRRVLDVILESIGLAGILFENVISEVQVAGTWSATRHECGFQFYKTADQGWDSFFAAVPQIEPRGYTRLGPALRHGAEVLAQSKAHKRLLLLLTDGKPTDLDGYEGRYGVYDVKQACLEAEARGLLPFALTIDQEAKHHFPKMFNHYKLLHKPENLSEELYQIFLRLLRRTR